MWREKGKHMNDLYFVSGCDVNAQKNVERTLDQKVNLEEKCREAGTELEKLLKEHEIFDYTAVNVWGCKENSRNKWKKMNLNDRVLYYGKRKSGDTGPSLFTHYGRVIAKIQSQRLAEVLWGDKEFEYIHVCDSTDRVNLDKNMVFKHLNYDLKFVQGFMRVASPEYYAYVKRLGSTDYFIEHLKCKNFLGVKDKMTVETASEKRCLSYNVLREELDKKKLELDYQDPVDPPRMKKITKKSQDSINEDHPDFQAINKVKGSLGELGETIVKLLEEKRLEKAGCGHLASKIEIMSRKSNKYGYDILSFNEDGTKRFIEVKTTTKGIAEPFKITYRELETSRNYEDTGQYWIYRIYGLKAEPFQYGYYQIRGKLFEQLGLDPLVYNAYLK